MSGDWVRRRVPLRMRIGDVTVMAPGLDLWDSTALDVGATPLGPADPLPAPPALDGAAGYLLRSRPVATRWPVLGLAGGYLRYVPEQYERFAVDLTGGYDDYLGKFSSKTRSTLKRKVRKVAEAGGGTIDWRAYRTPDAMAEFHQLARRVSERTYQERLLDAGLPGDTGFVEHLRALAAADAVRAWLLFLNDEPIAYLCCPVRDGVLIYEYLGFDPAARQLSPGTVLQLLALKALFAEGRFRAFDFTEGEGEHKRLFATTSRPCADIFVLRPSLRAWTLVLGQIATDGGVRIAGRLLDRIGLKKRLKAWLRRGSTP